MGELTHVCFLCSLTFVFCADEHMRADEMSESHSSDLHGFLGYLTLDVLLPTRTESPSTSVNADAGACSASHGRPYVTGIRSVLVELQQST